MDYTKQPLPFKMRKTLRYMRLYGARRTVAKVESHYHMNRRYAVMPALPHHPRPAQHVGMIGCGKFAYSNIAYYLTKNYGRIIRGAMDIDAHHAASLFCRYGLSYYTVDAEELLADPKIDLVYIASNHASHAEYAIRALEQNKSVHIEKPHVVREEQLIRLCRAMLHSDGKVTLGFNRPNSKIAREIRRHLDGQSGPAIYNWFIAGHEIEADHWYFREEEGGRVLGNLCHWTDFVLQLVPANERHPITIRPTRAHRADCDCAVTFTFGDGSIAVISFSAKGHTFEGVRERFAGHRGDVLVSLDDFKRSVIDRVDKRYVVSLRYRDHGHEDAIRNSYRMVRPDGVPAAACDVEYVWETGQLFLKTKEALENRAERIVLPYSCSFSTEQAANVGRALAASGIRGAGR